MSQDRIDDGPTSTQARGVRITPRAPDLTFANKGIPRLWHSDSAAISAFWNALSAAAPGLEAFFIHDVRELAPLLRHPALKQEVEAFVRQEALHSATHRRLNAILVEWGYPLERFEGRVRRFVDLLRRSTPSKLRVAVGMAGEQFIGELGDSILTNPKALSGAHPEVARLWRWHSLEEVEHKAVLFDAFYDAHGSGWSSYLHRVAGLWIAIVGLLYLLPPMVWTMVAIEGKPRDLSEWRRLARHLFGPEGLLRGRVRAIVEYMKPGFHPWKYLDNTALLSREYESIIDPAWAQAARGKGDVERLLR